MEELGPQDPRWIGDYRLLRKLGEGGMGRVYLARSSRGRTVAVKLVQSELARQADFRNRFRLEVQAAQRVGGQWTAAVLDADTEAEVPWVATGYIGGPSLHTVVAEEFGALPEATVRAMAHGLALALRDIHGAGLIHRDLKPSNVLVTIDGPRVIDFGIARALEGGQSSLAASGLTMTGAVIGSPGFMSPEQVRGEPVTAASDIFCLGSVLAFAATGRQPFGSSTSGIHTLLYRIAQEEPDLEGIPEGLRELVTACLRKDVAKRPSVDEIAAHTSGGTDFGAASAEPWLPGGLLARLGREALQLLETEAPQPNVAGPAGPIASSGPSGPSAYANPSSPIPSPPPPGNPSPPYGVPANAYAGGAPASPAPQPGQNWQSSPYQAPARSPAQGGVSISSPRGLGKALMVLFSLWIMATLFHMSLNISVLDAAESAAYPDVAPSAFGNLDDAIEAAETLCRGLALLVTLVWLIWFWLTYRNAQILAPGGQRFTKGFSVGAWFIPIAQLWLPKQVANDVWRSSAQPGHRTSKALLNWWWMFFVLMFLSTPVNGIFSVAADSSHRPLLGAGSAVVDDALGLVAAVLTMFVVGRLTGMQERKAAQHQQAGVFGPPITR